MLLYFGYCDMETCEVFLQPLSLRVSVIQIFFCYQLILFSQQVIVLTQRRIYTIAYKYFILNNRRIKQRDKSSYAILH